MENVLISAAACCDFVSQQLSKRASLSVRDEREFNSCDHLLPIDDDLRANDRGGDD